MKHLVLGGVKSGKSRYAEAQAQDLLAADAQLENVCYIATAKAWDDEMAKRIAMHQSSRPSHWQTLEEPLALGQAISEQAPNKVILVDCLTLWLTNLLMLEDESQFQGYRENLLDVLVATPNNIILVSNESNMGVTPMGELSRRYCDEVGLLHQAIADRCQRVDLIVAGLPLKLK